MRAILCLLAATLLPALLGVPAGAGAVTHPRVAIVFEHAGSSLTDLTPIYAMHLPFGLGIFPKMRYSARALSETAKREGSAIAVAHIATGAPQIVGRLLPEFNRAGIVFVPVTEFLRGRARP